MTDPEIEIPARFWDMPRAEFAEVVARGTLNAEQCARLWRMTDRQDKPPLSLELRVNREDVLRIWPPRK